MYKIAFFGYSYSGKTTLFRKITGKTDDTYDPLKPNVGIGRFRDGVLERIAEISGAKKVVYPEFEFFDFKGVPAAIGFSDDYLKHLFETEIIVCIVKNFDGESEPEKEAGSLLMELIFYDTERIENLLSRADSAYKGLSQQQVKVLEAGLKLLTEEKLLNSLDEQDKKLLKGIEILTIKPVFVYVNGTTKKPFTLPLPHINQEIETLDEELFYNSIIQALSLITFYTIKGDIAQGWLVPESFTAKQAAGKVHQDIEKGFIRAATLHFKDYIEIKDWHKAKTSGLLKFLGPNSNIADKDIVEFYFH